MKKTLTEQWREGKLPEDTYYWKVCKENWIADKYEMYDYTKVYDVSKIECLAPVPSYDEYKELLHHSELSRNLVYEVLVNQKEYNELLDKAKENKRLQEQLDIAKTGINFVQDVLVGNKDSELLWDMVNGYLKATLDKIEEVK